MVPLGERTVDTHLHLWDLTTGRYGWLKPGDPLRRTFDASDAREYLSRRGIRRAITVQADDSLAETRDLIAAARANGWIEGVVGWVPLDGAEATRVAIEQLQELDELEVLKGVRSLAHSQPGSRRFSLATTLASARVLADTGLVLDVADPWPDVLVDAISLARAVPELVIVLDHLGKPPVGGSSPARQSWAKGLQLAAELPNIVAKLSGLTTCLVPRAQWNRRTVEPVVATALDLFGADRLMLGTDWPISLRHAGADESVLGALLGELSLSECNAVTHRTAERVYRLTASADPAASDAR